MQALIVLLDYHCLRIVEESCLIVEKLWTCYFRRVLDDFSELLNHTEFEIFRFFGRAFLFLLLLLRLLKSKVGKSSSYVSKAI